MQSIWSKDENRKHLYKTSEGFREALSELLQKKIKEGTVTTDYDSPSWSHKQAHLNGYNEAIREVLLLIRDKDKQ